MKIKESPPSYCVEIAVEQANKSPCQKSKRGVVIYDHSSKMFSVGFNSSPNFICNGSQVCKKHCNQLCVHAEQAALIKLTAEKKELNMLHVKTKKGKLVPSGEPSCWQCSRLVLSDERISWFWLFHEDGWYKYSTNLFHDLTLKNCKLPIIS